MPQPKRFTDEELKEHKKAYAKRYEEEHRDELLERRKELYQTRKDYYKEYNEKNKERIEKCRKAHYAKHPKKKSEAELEANRAARHAQHWEKRVCVVCGAEFEVSGSKRSKNKRTCGRECMYKDPRCREARSASKKAELSRPGVREKMSADAKKRCSTPEFSKQMRQIAKKRFEDPAERERLAEIVRQNVRANPEIIEKGKKAQREYWSKPENRAASSESQKRRFENPEEREKTGAASRKYYAEHPEKAIQIGETRRMENISHKWYGDVVYHDGPQYCDKWTAELRRRVRAFFGNVCLECGSPQHGRLLSVHHVHYNKKLCCDTTPRTLVPLCKSCHSKTNSDREYWSEHFQEIVDTYYGGKCWFTREEYAALMG